VRDYMTIGSSPYDEDCAQVGTPDYYERTKIELNALKNQMLRVLGEPPALTSLSIKAFPHDFGTYHELVCNYDDDDDASTEYAFRCEAELPAKWDDEALAEMKGHEKPTYGIGTIGDLKESGFGAWKKGGD